MRKVDELNRPDSTWRKASDDEPLFILRPTDKNMPETVLHWIGLSARNGVSPEKLRKAFEHYLDAVKWQRDNPGSVGVPD